MKDAPSSPLIDVQLLRVGMFVHLDVGWMAHPFPRSSFKISSPEQIATIAKLGTQKVRWSPEKSDLAPDDAAPVVATATASVSQTPEDAARREHREKLAAERAVLEVCEGQFAEATQACKEIAGWVSTKPLQARDQSEALVRALVHKLIGQKETCIRLLTDGAGDKSSLHAINVAVIALLIGKNLGLSEDEMLDLGVGAMLHDVGKTALPEWARHHDAHFTQAELASYREHVVHGVTMARNMRLKPGAALVIAQHHEHADGSGFPLKVSSDRISVASQVVALVNRFDNLCNPQGLSHAVTPHEAMSLLFTLGKNYYEAGILGCFIRMMGIYPPGSTVQLTDDRYAVVVSVNSARPLKPRVLVHEPRVPREEALLLDLEADSRLGIRRSLKPQHLPSESMAYLAPGARAVYFFEPAHESELSGTTV